MRAGGLRAGGVRAGGSRAEIGTVALACVLAFEAAALALALLVFDARQSPLAYAASMVGASMPWLWLCWCGVRGRLPRLRHVLIAGCILRALVQFAPGAVLSDDIYRYVWEGRVQLAGHNPFLESPASLSELGASAPEWPRMNNRKITAAYPPVGQLFLRALVWICPNPRTVRLAFALCDVLVMFLLAAWLSRVGRPSALCLVHALCPLSIVEFCVEGHNDSLGIAILLGALCLWSIGRIRLAGAALGAAVSCKFLPILVLPWLARRDRRVVLPCLGVFVLSYLPFWPGFDRVPQLLEGLRQYGTRWRSNESLFWFLAEATRIAQHWFADAGVTGWLVELHAQRVSKIPLALVMVVFFAVIYRRVRNPAHAFVALLLVVFSFTPTLHPWYVGWIVPFLALVQAPAAFVLIATVSFSYHVLGPYHRGEGWNEQLGWKLVEYVPFYGVLLWSWWRYGTPAAPRPQETEVSLPQ